MISKILKRPLFIILILFIIWRLALIFVGIFATSYVPLGNKDRFLGGGPQNYKGAPEFFSWANYDGEHYLSISIHGYKFLEQAFFPVYPILISFFAKPLSYDAYSSLIYSILSGLLISNLAFYFALYFLWKLITYDFSDKIAYLTIIILLVFPTSFYFGAVYNESLFLLLSILSFYYARKGRWILAAFFGGLSSATRIFGLMLLPALLIEAWQQKLNFKQMMWLFLIPAGLIFYMLYQYLTVGDALAFYRLQKIVGEQHQSGLTLLPQVYFRYIKMFLTVDRQNPIFQTIILEFIVGVGFFILPIYGYFKKVRLSYLVFAFLGFLTPTIQGSFSSVPRYVIVFFPSFLALAIWLDGLPKLVRNILCLASLAGLFLETSLFLRGYWVA